MSNKPVVLVTRKLPAAVEQRLAENFDTILNPEDKRYSTNELLELAAGADAILPWQVLRSILQESLHHVDAQKS